MKILKVNSQISITPFYKTDASNLVKYLNDKSVYENMLVIPYPYKLSDAEWFLDKVLEEQEKGIHEYKAIRMGEELIGGAGFKITYGLESHKDEIAYWLAAPFRNKGIMSAVLAVLCKDAFARRGLKRIEASTFEFNKASQKALEKARFKFEGVLRNFHKKNEKFIDVKMYSLIPEDLEVI